MALPGLDDFVALNQPEARRAIERRGDYFVVEGILAIERLLGLPQWHVRTLALLPKVADRLAPLLADVDVPVVVADEAELREVVGFDLHRGALASVDRRRRSSVADLVATERHALLLACEGVNDHENLGSLYRNAAAFGAVGVVLDPTSADPFYRRSIRVSQGNVLALPTATMTDLHELQHLGVTTVALTPSGDRDLSDLRPGDLGPGPVAVVVGAEGPGLTAAALEQAQHRVRIPMASGVDSINVATAAAIALHHLRQLRLGGAS